jgi:hypothetical protein
MTTLKRTAPLPTAGQPPHPLLKRKIITIPLRRIEDQQIPLPEFRTLVRSAHTWQEQLRQQEVADDIADFERRVTGDSFRGPRIPQTPLSPAQAATLHRFLPQPVTSDASRVPPPVRVFSRPTSVTATAPRLNQPATWNLLDEPLVPARPTPCPGLKLRQHRPFTRSGLLYDRFGIPVISSEMIDRHDRKISEYENSMHYLDTSASQKAEQQLRESVHRDRLTYKAKREARTRACASMGQAWALRAVGELPEKTLLPPVEEMSPEDAEAMRFLNRKEEDLMDEYHEKKKEMREARARALRAVADPGV